MTEGRGGRPGTPEIKRYLPEGQPVQDVILDIPPLNAMSNERLGYPTQKPIALLDRIIRASSNEGDVVFDPFCGCGTTLFAAHLTSRKWIGCDIAILPVQIVKKTLEERYGVMEGRDFLLSGIPVSVAQAEDLLNRDPRQFKSWAVELLGGFPLARIDQELFDGCIFSQPGEQTFVFPLVVKEAVRPGDLRRIYEYLLEHVDVPGVGIVTLQEPSRATVAELQRLALSWPVKPAPLQLLTIRELLHEGKRFATLGADWAQTLEPPQGKFL
jgi:hypothetical protein